MHPSQLLFRLIGWMFGLAVFAIGVINTFWGNDMGFGIFLILLSLIYFPPVDTVIKRLVGFSVPVILKMILAVFIIIAALGVGELFNKIDI
ncbi:hypothetical protein FK178_10055 [Antarcticibacterium arcticum]|uniref:Uncharacterized protein n=2 Tax=Antarcticibacterium arcticum TaxID=2585771 RepID=A0A5B8YQT9_9FLAO|nr:hypothetical protein FK178_10055 [Antarcticibacterium arcticum]